MEAPHWEAGPNQFGQWRALGLGLVGKTNPTIKSPCFKEMSGKDSTQFGIMHFGGLFSFELV